MASAPLVAAGPPTPTAGQLLTAGRWRMAIMSLRYQLASDPERSDLRQKLGFALLKIGKCRASLEQLDLARAGGAWSSESAAHEGACYALLGQTSAALAAYEESEQLASTSEHRRAWTLYQLAAVEAGETDAVAALELVYAGDSESLVPARVAESVGGLSLALDGWRQPAAQREAQRIEWLRLSAVAALRDGDPYGAEERARELHRLRRLDLRPIALQAEAVRRQGDPRRAAQGLERPIVQGVDIVPVLAVRARVAADLGDREQALGLAAGLATAESADALAARWVVARRFATGEEHALAQAYAREGYDALEALDRYWVEERR